MPKSALVTEEPDLDSLFANAMIEIAEQVDEDDLGTDYGFQSQWEDDEQDEEDEDERGDEEDEEDDDEEDEVEHGKEKAEKAVSTELVLGTTKVLFDALSEYAGHEESIERFCLPIFTKAQSDYAVAHVFSAFKKRPSMSQIYAAYLARFLDSDEVRQFLVGLVGDFSLVDWQRMWVLAALSQTTKAKSDDLVAEEAWKLLSDANRDNALKAVAATYIGHFGDHARRKSLAAIYPTVTDYVQVAIYCSSRHWPKVERSNAKAQWGGHGPLHRLATAAIKSEIELPF